jgi:hypothetical protein
MMFSASLSRRFSISYTPRVRSNYKRKMWWLVENADLANVDSVCNALLARGILIVHGIQLRNDLFELVRNATRELFVLLRFEFVQGYFAPAK